MEAGLLWHKITRTNSHLGLQVSSLNFIPASGETFELMSVDIKNTSKKSVTVVPTSAVPIYARSADNLRDHRHVTSLLNRIAKTSFGIRVSPTMSFNEKGHLPNDRTFFVAGMDRKENGPVGCFPTWESFIGRDGDFERPSALFNDGSPRKNLSRRDQGKEMMGALQFESVTLKPGQSTSLVLLLGTADEMDDTDQWVSVYGQRSKWESAFEETKSYWRQKATTIVFRTGDREFNRWVRWVGVQPFLRNIFGCSFLPDFDYGRGGRGWRDLWQDCLALLLADPTEVRPLLLANFGGVRIDGSNATIIGRKDGDSSEPEFIADRNNVTRTWMDHGVWPYLTTDLYIHQTGDWDLLLEDRPYFRDAHLRRARKLDERWEGEPHLKDKSGRVLLGSILEHILVQHLVQFFNVGGHGLIRLEDADWNDGLDMARVQGESVAFTSFYAGNLSSLADLLELARERKGWRDVTLTAELTMLLDRVGTRPSYDSVEEKRRRLDEYYEAIEKGLSGSRASVPISTLVNDLREKSASLMKVINENEWIEGNGLHWYNGYYDNKGRQVEGPNGFRDAPRMTLTGQVFPIFAGVADERRIRQVIGAVNEHLWDHDLQGFRLNTDFGDNQFDLGRAFSFAYGEKENGSVFSHMVVMYANALYRRDFIDEGHRALDSLFRLAKNSSRSRIFPGLPEYFDNEGRGRYAYLTGSASWLLLTLLTEVFGVRGRSGDLVLAPRLVPEQFDAEGTAAVEFNFAGKRITVTFYNNAKKPISETTIQSVKNGQGDIPVTRLGPARVLIQREILMQKDIWAIDVRLEPTEP